MACCGIMRVDKCRRSDVYGLQIESNRTLEDHIDGRDFAKSDIDWEKTDDNIFLIKEENWNKYITKYLKDNKLKERKDSVVMLDGIYTASSEFFERISQEEMMQYFNDCLKFHEENYGHTFNAVIHLDEATPHLTVKSIPLIEDEKGKHLSAKIIMGLRADYRLRQDQFYDQVSSKYGLERGQVLEAEDIKRHLTVQEYKEAKLEQNIQALENKKLKVEKKIDTTIKNIEDLSVEAVKISGEVQKNLMGKETGYVLYPKTFAEKLEKAAAQLKAISPMIKKYNEVISNRDAIIKKAKSEAKSILRDEQKYRDKRSAMEQELKILKDFIKSKGYDAELVIKNGMESLKQKIKHSIKM